MKAILRLFRNSQYYYKVSIYNIFMNIICPVCKNELNKIDRSYKCLNNHNFDIAKEGYINLYLKASTNSGDEKEMIKARKLFLNKGHYHFLREKINELIKSFNTIDLVDLACGEGYYTSYFEAINKIGIDLSKEGLKIASKTDKNTTYILSSIFNTPLKDHSIDTIITCFAPIAKEEIVRLLKKDGHFILVHPDQRHLYELKEAVYDNPYLNELEDIQIEGLEKIDEIHLSSSSVLDNEELKALFQMTPYTHKTSISDKEKLNYIDKLSVSFEFIISIYKSK